MRIRCVDLVHRPDLAGECKHVVEKDLIEGFIVLDIDAPDLTDAGSSRCRCLCGKNATDSWDKPGDAYAARDPMPQKRGRW